MALREPTLRRDPDDVPTAVAAPDLLQPQRPDMAGATHHLPAVRDDDADQQCLLYPAEVSRLTCWSDTGQRGDHPCQRSRR